MKRLMRSLWKEPVAWALAGCYSLIFFGCMALFFAAQRADYQRRLDASVVATVDQIKGELATIRVQNERSIEDRRKLHQKQEVLQRKIEGKP